MHDYAHGNEAVLAARPRALLHTGKRDTITRVAIQGFKCADTQELFETDRSQQFGSIRKLATRKLGMLDAAATLKDLESPPGNRLEALTRERDNTAYGSMINGESALFGRRRVQRT